MLYRIPERIKQLHFAREETPDDAVPIASSDSKELPSPSDNAINEVGTKSIDSQTGDKSAPQQDTKSETPEIKANVTDLGTNKDSDLGTSDLKKPQKIHISK